MVNGIPDFSNIGILITSSYKIVLLIADISVNFAVRYVDFCITAEIANKNSAVPVAAEGNTRLSCENRGAVHRLSDAAEGFGAHIQIYAGMPDIYITFLSLTGSESYTVVSAEIATEIGVGYIEVNISAKGAYSDVLCGSHTFADIAGENRQVKVAFVASYSYPLVAGKTDNELTLTYFDITAFTGADTYALKAASAYFYAAVLLENYGTVSGF